MFTGLIEAVGVLTSVARTDAGIELHIDSPWDDLVQGESICVNGACLTVLAAQPASFRVAAMTMTVARTTIGSWEPGKRVNLERAMRGDSRFGGHIVQGHVDGIACVNRIARVKDAVLLDVALPRSCGETLVLHGSVCLDGVSLTVNALDGDKLQVALIGYTLQHTALGDLEEGDALHVETDVIGKYVRRLVEPYVKQ